MYFKLHRIRVLKAPSLTLMGSTINHWQLEIIECRPGQCILQAGVYHAHAILGLHVTTAIPANRSQSAVCFSHSSIN